MIEIFNSRYNDKDRICGNCESNPVKNSEGAYRCIECSAINVRIPDHLIGPSGNLAADEFKDK